MVSIRIYVYFQSIVSLFLVKEREWEDWTRALIINTVKHLTIFSFFQCNLVCLSISIFFLSSVSLFPVNEIEREDWTRNLKKISKTFATLRRLIFVNINFHEINFLVDFFSPIQFCHISRGFIFEDEETYIISPEHFSAVARCAMCVIIGGNKGLIFVKPLKLCQLNQYKSPLLFRGQL